MIAVIQRVKSCSITINNKIHSSIGCGILVFIGIECGDSIKDINFIAHKIINLRIFNDNHGKMNLSVLDINAEIMIVSQFTLCGDIKKGNRPSYINAMDADPAKKVYDSFIDYIKGCYSKIKSGTFQEDMDINLINDGPVTLIIRSKD